MTTNTSSLLTRRVTRFVFLASLILLYSIFCSNVLSVLLKTPITDVVGKNGKENQDAVFIEKQIILLNSTTMANVVMVPQQTSKDKNHTSSKDHSNNAVISATTISNSNNHSIDSPLIVQSQLNQNKVRAGVGKKRTEKKQQLQHCWRHCPQRINKIYFHHGMAGLGDRHTVIHMLAQMAGYLCAELELPPPSVSLTTTHNNHKVVSKLVQWQDFFNLTFIQDNSPVVSLNPSLGKNFENWYDIPVYDHKDKYADWFYILQTGTDFVSAYKKLQEFSWSQE